MKPIKMLGLALVAVLATTALLGASSASAKVGLCKKMVEVCPAEEQYGPGTEIEGTQSSQTTKLKDESFLGTTEVQCQKSAITVKLIKKISEEQQWEGVVENGKASWSECKRVNAAQEVKEQCTVTPLQMPWTVHIEQTGAQNEYKGIMWTEEREGRGQPGAEIACPNLPVTTEKSKETQTGGLKEQAIQAEITSATQPASIILNQRPLKSPVGQGFWTETYTVAKPTTPMYVTQQG